MVTGWKKSLTALRYCTLVPKNDKMHLTDTGFHLDLTDFV